MSILNALILGVVQGVTEFLPVSSSGHLILVRELFGVSLDGSLAFDTVLHFATALAVLVYFRRDILLLVREPMGQRQKVLWLALILGTIPAVVVGFFFEGAIDLYTRSAGVVAWMLIVGSLLFIVAEWLGKRRDKNEMGSNESEVTAKKGFMIGLFQMLALAPGISRSGASISGGMLFGLSREEATRFAFLLSLPVILGAGILKSLELGAMAPSQDLILALVVGSVFAFVVGLAAIHFMISFVRDHSLGWFAVYRILLAVVVLLVF